MSTLQKILMGAGIAGIWILTLVAAVKMSGKMSDPVIMHDTTTVVIHETDTVVIAEPILKDEIFLRTEIRRLKAELASRPSVTYDTICTPCQTDSVDVEIPISQRHYVDSTYEAWVSGYDPHLDSLTIFRNNTVIRQYIPIQIKKTTRPKVCVTAGPYAGYGPDGFGYGLGITVGYPIIVF